MPELPEVETVRTGLEPEIISTHITAVQVARRDLRVPVTSGLEKKACGARITAVKRRAKYLLLSLDNGKVLVIHLGMSGRLLLRPQASYKPQKHDHLRIQLSNGKEMVFNDARRFGLVLLLPEAALATHLLFAHLGPEPLAADFNAAYLKRALSSRAAPIKTVLMDQALVVGVGNIYASEALFRVGLHPQTSAKLCADKAAALVKAIRTVLQEAIASGGSTLRNYAQASGESGYFQHRFAVYGREGEACFSCGDKLLRITQAGRSTFFCPTCQPALKPPRRRG